MKVHLSSCLSDTFIFDGKLDLTAFAMSICSPQRVALAYSNAASVIEDAVRSSHTMNWFFVPPFSLIAALTLLNTLDLLSHFLPTSISKAAV